MKDSALHRQYEELIHRVLRNPDPARAMQAAREQLPENHPIAAALSQVDKDGLRMTALLMAKLRFERLVQGSEQANRWFEEDAEGFALAFRNYHAEIPMRAFFPREEAADFARWQKQNQRRSTK